MSKEFLQKKIEQITTLLVELRSILDRPFDAFQNDPVVVHAAERDFQLTIDLASDINSHILVEKGGPIPDSYHQSFIALAKADIIPGHLARHLVESAKLRNILVHEYDFEEDYRRFYESAKSFLPLYQQYLEAIQKYIS